MIEEQLAVAQRTLRNSIIGLVAGVIVWIAVVVVLVVVVLR